MNQRTASPERKNCTVSPRATPCEHVRTSISRIIERTQSYGSIGTHQEQAPGYPTCYRSVTEQQSLLMRPFSLHASHGATRGRVFPFARMQGGTHKFQVLAVEDVQGRAVEKVHKEVRSASTTSLVHSNSFRSATVSSLGHPQRHLFTVLLFGWQQFHHWDTLNVTCSRYFFSDGTPSSRQRSA